MERDELANWLRLTLTPGIGNLTARKLLAAFGLPEAIFSQSPSALQQVVTPAQADALLTEPPELPAQLDTTWHWLQNQEGSAPRQILALGDSAYPSALLQIEDPPLLLYAMGRLDLPLDPAQSLAMVGSRNPTPQGALNARQFAQSLSQAGLTIVSGLALGVDGAAHEGALAGADDSRLATIAVVGTGLDRVYPKRHHQLAHDIAQHGLIVSEYPLGTPPLAANFPRRNRLIAGLSCSTLVIEAALQSGSLITARLAAEQGKDVFAIPGSIHAMQSHGCHALIRQGAKLVESAQDVLEDLPGVAIADRMPTPAPASMETEDSLLQALGFDPVSLDALQARTGLATAPLQARLMTLELDDQVARLPGGLFQRIATT
ncbi:MAG: DNA-processing protein DprA [Hylemonella sp.]|nr:DNA-processing protein DprA [Hylemonella sp.]MDP1937585.1 DNA-processing protein DprA [Hylemonella sp.]